MVQNSPMQLNNKRLTVFDSQNIPNISIDNYLTRIMTFSGTSSRSLVMSLAYIDRITNRRENNITLTRHNVHRLVLVSTMMASIFYDDIHYDDQTWSRIGGVNVSEVRRLKLNFLDLINYQLNVNVD